MDGKTGNKNYLDLFLTIKPLNSITFHKNFQLNGNSFFSTEELLQFTKKKDEIHQFLKEWFSDDDDFITVKTSGSTGNPKWIQLKKEYVIHSALATGKFFNIKQNTTALLCLPLQYISGKMMLIRALVLGWKLDIVPPDAHPLKAISKEYDFSAFVPLQLNNSLNKIHKIKKLIVGGGSISKELKQNIQLVKTKIFATYGMTETITHIAVQKLNHFSKSSQKLGYTVLPNISIFKDHRGCLVIDAPKISHTKIITNDVVHIISNTEFEWVGRFDNIINSGGIKLHPEKIEEKLSKIIKERFFVAGISDIVLGEKLILIIEKGESIKNLKSQISKIKTISKYEIPKEIHFLEHFINTETQKIHRKKTINLLRSLKNSF